MMYPMHVLCTNRVCDTVISRSSNPNKIRILSDFRNIYSLTGVFIGIIPYTLSYLYSCFTIKKYKNDDGLLVK